MARAISSPHTDTHTHTRETHRTRNISVESPQRPARSTAVVGTCAPATYYCIRSTAQAEPTAVPSQRHHEPLLRMAWRFTLQLEPGDRWGGAGHAKKGGTPVVGSWPPTPSSDLIRSVLTGAHCVCDRSSSAPANGEIHVDHVHLSNPLRAALSRDPGGGRPGQNKRRGPGPCPVPSGSARPPGSRVFSLPCIRVR